MNLNQLHYWPGIVVIFLTFTFVVLSFEKKFFKMVKTYWFYHRSVLSYVSSLLLILGMGGLIFSLLDLRGPEEKIKTAVMKDRTIILIDTSASMLAEDVKPSRLEKAALIAKHFARKAAGQQLSIVAFSEIQKKIVPFTNDLDLIDARLDSIKGLKNQYGSSALSLAIQESVQYLRDADGEAHGNILVLTDGEETADGIDLKVPKQVHIALVGVGTTNGGRIPLDDGRGFRFGYKKDRGQDIITKLNENFFKRAAEDVPSGKYWLANSYSLPSEEILDFFQQEKTKGLEEQDMVVKPVMMEWLVIPSIILLLLSYFLKSLKILSLGLLLIIAPVNAQENKQPELSPEVISGLEQLQQGKLNRPERLKLADDLRKGGAKEEALSLYGENLPSEIDKSLPPEAYLNYGAALLEKGDPQKALSVYEKLSKSLGDDDRSKEIKDSIDKNILSYFKQVEQKKKQEKENKENKEKKDKKDDQQQSGQGKPDQKDNQGKQDKKESGESKDKKEEDKKDQEGKDDKEKKDEADKDKNKDQEKSEPEEKKPMPPQKIPAKLKQLMSDDRQLQMKMIENGTRDLNKRKSRKSKDW